MSERHVGDALWNALSPQPSRTDAGETALTSAQSVETCLSFIPFTIQWDCVQLALANVRLSRGGNLDACAQMPVRRERPSGTGCLRSPFSPPLDGFAQATGCDPSTGMLSSNVSFRTFEQPSSVELPFDDSSFDFVTAVCVMHHVH